MSSARESARRRLSVVSASSPVERPAGEPPAPLQRDLVLGGRRYRLIPLEGEADGVPAEEPVTNLLTFRELEIVALVAQGRVNKQIADDLQISEWTVSTHLRR